MTTVPPETSSLDDNLALSDVEVLRFTNDSRSKGWRLVESRLDFHIGTRFFQKATNEVANLIVARVHVSSTGATEPMVNVERAATCTS